MDKRCRQGMNSVSIVGRLSTLQSVHYQRFHCTPNHIKPLQTKNQPTAEWCSHTHTHNPLSPTTDNKTNFSVLWLVTLRTNVQ